MLNTTKPCIAWWHLTTRRIQSVDSIFPIEIYSFCDIHLSMFFITLTTHLYAFSMEVEHPRQSLKSLHDPIALNVIRTDMHRM